MRVRASLCALLALGACQAKDLGQSEELIARADIPQVLCPQTPAISQKPLPLQKRNRTEVKQLPEGVTFSTNPRLRGSQKLWRYTLPNGSRLFVAEPYTVFVNYAEDTFADVQARLENKRGYYEYSRRTKHSVRYRVKAPTNKLKPLNDEYQTPLGSINVTINHEMKLPRWVYPDYVTREDLAQWTAFICEREMAEMIRMDITYDSMLDFVTQAGQVKSSSEGALRRERSQLWRDIISDMKRRIELLETADIRGDISDTSYRDY